MRFEVRPRGTTTPLDRGLVTTYTLLLNLYDDVQSTERPVESVEIPLSEVTAVVEMLRNGETYCRSLLVARLDVGGSQSHVAAAN